MKFMCLSMAALLLMFCTACNHAGNKNLEFVKEKVSPNHTADLDLAAETLNADSAMPQQAHSSKQFKQTGSIPVTENWDKKIIRKATLSLEIKSYQSFDKLFRNTVKNLGGYIAAEQQNQSDYKIENVVTIKIPADHFDDAVVQLIPAAAKLLTKEITSEDVTAEVVDTKSRIEAKNKIRERYLDLLQRAKNMDEILQVQNEINEIQEQVESANGRVKYLSHEASYSTIQLNFFEELNAGPGINNDPAFGYRIAASFKSGLQGIGEFLILLVNFWPLCIILTTMYFLFKKYRPRLVKKA